MVCLLRCDSSGKAKATTLVLLSYTLDSKLKDNLKPLIKILTDQHPLQLTLNPSNFKTLKASSALVIGSQSELKLFLNKYLPQFEIISPVIPEIFGKSTWVVIPRIRRNQLEAAIVLNYNRFQHIPQTEETQILVFLQAYLWRCISYFGACQKQDPRRKINKQ